MMGDEDLEEVESQIKSGSETRPAPLVPWWMLIYTQLGCWRL